MVGWARRLCLLSKNVLITKSVGGRAPTLHLATALGDCSWHCWVLRVGSKLLSITGGRAGQVWLGWANYQEDAGKPGCEVTRHFLWTLFFLEPTTDLMELLGKQSQTRGILFRLRTTYSTQFTILNSSCLLQPLLCPPTNPAIKRPSPDWNVRNADVTALDKLLVTVLSWISVRGQRS